MKDCVHKDVKSVLHQCSAFCYVNSSGKFVMLVSNSDYLANSSAVLLICNFLFT